MKFKSRLQANMANVGAKTEAAKGGMFTAMAKLAPRGSMRDSLRKKALQSVNSSLMFSDQAKQILNRKR